MIELNISVICDSCGKRKKIKYAEDKQGKPIYNLPPGWGGAQQDVYILSGVLRGNL